MPLPPRPSLLASQPNANGTSSRASVTFAQRKPRIQCDTGKNHLPRGRQILKAVVMPLPEAGVAVGAGVVVEVEVRAEDGVRARPRSRCTRRFRLRFRIFVYNRGGGGGNEERNGFPISIPVTIPLTSPITTPITKDITVRSGPWSGPGVWLGTKTFTLAIDRLFHCDIC